ncbi:hypothetical protein JCM10207_007634 [Rhodosporidiobolus poonsookiae]
MQPDNDQPVKSCLGDLFGDHTTDPYSRTLGDLIRNLRFIPAAGCAAPHESSAGPQTSDEAAAEILRLTSPIRVASYEALPSLFERTIDVALDALLGSLQEITLDTISMLTHLTSQAMNVLSQLLVYVVSKSGTGGDIASSSVPWRRDSAQRMFPNFRLLAVKAGTDGTISQRDLAVLDCSTAHIPGEQLDELLNGPQTFTFDELDGGEEVESSGVGAKEGTGLRAALAKNLYWTLESPDAHEWAPIGLVSLNGILWCSAVVLDEVSATGHTPLSGEERYRAPSLDHPLVAKLFTREDVASLEAAAYLAASKVNGEPLVPRFYGHFRSDCESEVIILEAFGDSLKDFHNLSAAEKSTLFTLVSRLHLEAHLAHHDVAPRNVLLNDAGEMRLIDLETCTLHECAGVDACELLTELREELGLQPS